ncbi:hypothetical protein F4555_001342 [Mobiluncus mulieris]|uniref:Uncharacterized protein n=1 Tax=Mobiluncus mulieris TaxID=2052 RepID=A0A8G2HUT5_9ACTO|nr:hypothetical protein [Mobiluncus mulieris]MBB5846546.1 hypothetical protein [Mobiluncus mulieris]MCV0011707.1 hypothetical protein [Mobiluncus mulieris]STO16978.1 Uncharacterised protein [Mobiluncus mulieris]
MDISNLTIGEIAAVEKYSGKKLGEISEAAEGNNVDVRLMTALALVFAKRGGFPQATMDDIEQLNMDEIAALLEKPTQHVAKRSEIAEAIAASLPPLDAETVGELSGATPKTTPDLR